MIDTKHIQRGNFLLHKDGIVQVEDICAEAVYGYQDLPSTINTRTVFRKLKGYYVASVLDGIPIIPKILRKCGFEYRNNTPFMCIDLPNGTGELSINASPDSIGYGTVWLRKNEASLNPASIKYLHELQNFYYWISRHQLTYFK